MTTRLTQHLTAGEQWNMSQLGHDPMTIASVTHNRANGTVVLEGVREKNGKTYWVTIPSDIELA
jgi:hypothetical protein